jgi:hypothetical protein
VLCALHSLFIIEFLRDDQEGLGAGVFVIARRETKEGVPPHVFTANPVFRNPTSSAQKLGKHQTTLIYP